MKKQKENMRSSTKETKKAPAKGGCGCKSSKPADKEEVVEIEKEEWKY